MDEATESEEVPTPPEEEKVEVTLIIKQPGGLVQTINFSRASNLMFDLKYEEYMELTKDELENYKGPVIEKVVLAFVPHRDGDNGYFTSDIVADGEEVPDAGTA